MDTSFSKNAPLGVSNNDRGDILLGSFSVYK